jgi:hypothetical protein
LNCLEAVELPDQACGDKFRTTARGIMKLKYLLPFTAAVLLAATAAHAFEMQTLTNPNGGAAIADPDQRFEDAKKPAPSQQGGLSFQVYSGQSYGTQAGSPFFSPSRGPFPAYTNAPAGDDR